MDEKAKALIEAMEYFTPLEILREVRAKMEAEQNRNRSRELACAITKTEEAEMWLERRDKRAE